MARCVSFFSVLLEDPFFAGDLLFLFVDYEPERSYFIVTRIRAERQFAHVDTSCVPYLGLCDESTTGRLLIVSVVDSASVPVSVRCHHDLHAGGSIWVVRDFARARGYMSLSVMYELLLMSASESESRR
jgi:hypothetical protein